MIIGYIPFAAIVFAIGAATQVWPDTFPWQGVYLGFVLAAASLGYIAFACFRYVEPGKPRLTLAPDGIHQRLSRGRMLHIPWNEVRDIAAVDYTFNASGITHTIRDIPAVVVSQAFYDRVMPPQPWLRRPMNWGHHVEAANGVVRVLFRHDLLGTTAQGLRHAIETRWRAFSTQPNARLPSQPVAPRSRLLSWLTTQNVLLLITVGTIAYFVWALIIKDPELSEATRSHYLAELLDKGGVTARLSDGRIGILRRHEVATTSTPSCETTRTRSWRPAYVTSASCTAQLALRSGGGAIAVYRIEVKTFPIEHSPGKFSEGHALVATPLNLEDADALACRLGHCGKRSFP